MKLIFATTTAMVVAMSGTTFAQGVQCDEGFVFDENDGVCVPDDGGGPDESEPKLIRFLTPEEGDRFDAGTTVAPTGRSSLTLVQDLPLDLTIILDNSISMNISTNIFDADLGRDLSRMELTQQALGSLLDVLPDDTRLTAITFGETFNVFSDKAVDQNFDGVADVRDFNGDGQPDFTTGLPQEDVIAFLQSADASEMGTDFGALFTGLFDVYNNTQFFTPSDDFDREFIILSDGEPTDVPDPFEVNIVSAFADPIFVSLPGNSPNGSTYLSNLATQTGGQFINTSSMAQELLDVFAGVGQSLVGIEALEITNPDGTTYAGSTDALGQFILDPYVLGEGDNIFTALATFEDGSSEFATLNLIGEVAVTDNPTIPPVPLPAAGWMLLAGLIGLGRLARR